MKTRRTGAVQHKRSLAVLLDLWAGAVFLAVIAGCVLIEYTRNPNVSVLGRLSHHMIELLLYGFILWGLLWLVLRVVVIRPIDEIFGQLYRIGGGDRVPVTVQTSIREIQSVVEAINIMLWRMEQQADVKALDHVRRKAVAIRQYVADSTDIPPAEVTALLDQLVDLEARLRDIGLPARIRAACKPGQDADVSHKLRS